MRVVDIIIKKRDRHELSQEEVQAFVQGYARGEVPDYQAAALAMAILLNGMTERETTDLTLAMAHSGELLDLSDVVPFAVDKHSTGGVGDKTTLVVEPIVAACGLPVGKMSGRGLGFSGGTLDKIESIPGFRTNLTTEEFKEQLRTIGMALTGQTANLAPADGKLYALRDVTGTVQSLPLIAASVMSKKIASGAQGIVLDVKWGMGAFMSSLDEARQLAQLMISIARLAGRKAIALLSDMNQPLGLAVGNALELREAIETLHGEGPADFREHCLEVAAQMLVIGDICPSVGEGKLMAQRALDQGQAWNRFRLLVKTQEGDVSFVDHPEKLPKAPIVETVLAPATGYLQTVNARIVGETAVALGAGREKKTDTIDPAVGVVIYHKVGDAIHQGEPLCVIHANRNGILPQARQAMLEAHTIVENPVAGLPLFYGAIA